MKRLFLIIAILGVVYLAPKFAHEFEVVQKEQKAILRDDFKQSILSKTPEQVLTNVGRPDTTQQSGTIEYWNYHHFTKDPITGKVDNNAQVVIEDGTVKRVNF